ncbi:MAG: hypothetical protein H0W83_15550, partial [Planctomycetes bacterium]|nr:hypothetical protein [Planctomycetota bacterium]
AGAYRDAQGPHCRTAPTREAAVAMVLEAFAAAGGAAVTVLVKASRSSGLEMVVAGVIAAVPRC